MAVGKGVEAAIYLSNSESNRILFTVGFQVISCILLYFSKYLQLSSPPPTHTLIINKCNKINLKKLRSCKKKKLRKYYVLDLWQDKEISTKK